MSQKLMRSAVSVEDSSRDMHGVSQYELSMEINRLNRKNGLLERSKQVLQEQLAIYKQEIASKNRRIQQLTLQIEQNSFLIAQTETQRTEHNDYSSFEVIFYEKEEQINYITTLLQQKITLLKELTQENQQLKQSLSDKYSLINRIKDSTNAQVDNQKNQIYSLQQQLSEKSKEIALMKVFYQNLAQKQTIKSHKIQQSLREKLKLAEQQKQNIISQQQSQQNQRQTLKQKNQQLLYELTKHKQTIKWLYSLLDQAKGQFINIQLKQQQKIEKEQRQKKQYQKRNKLLKTQLKNYKKQTSSNDTTMCQPNKNTRTISTFAVTPFRINSKRSRFSGGSDQTQ